jgi:membrane protein implicated in regulation of membrane protease activity
MSAIVESGELLFLFLMGVPVLALLLLTVLWLVFVVRRRPLGLIGAALIGSAFLWGQTYSLALFLLLLGLGILACVRASRTTELPISNKGS